MKPGSETRQHGSRTHSFFFSFYYFFWLDSEACGILVPYPGIELTLAALKTWSFSPWKTQNPHLTRVGRHHLALPTKLLFLLLLVKAMLSCNLFGVPANPGAPRAVAVGPSQANHLCSLPGTWILVKWARQWCSNIKAD